MEFLRLDIDINDTGMKQAQVTCQATITPREKNMMSSPMVEIPKG